MPIEILAGVLSLKVEFSEADAQPNTAELLSEISIWLPIFRGRANLVLALDALRSTDRRLAGVCSRYLEVLGAVQ